MGREHIFGESILMSYSGRTRYKTRREKNELIKKRARAILLFAVIGLVALAFKNRIAIRDYFISVIN